ncbi:unnamed protein product [Owenia fusiformis]|uniref:Uncharacterized protein n=1 Tax=Owenia fusiformis TaxID=6347 RepID=A0A8J1Y1B4_OWEFU|nr:unnamed protein product [Owenia fusiformis]
MEKAKLLFAFFCAAHSTMYFVQGAGWSVWLNRDYPSGKGDFETTRDFRKEGRLPCETPSAIECRTVRTHIPASKTGQVFHKKAACSVIGGLACYNRKQKNRRCLNYEVRYFCKEDDNVCSEPESHIQELPRGCEPRTFDVKKCSESSCKNQTAERQYDNEPEYCCGPTAQDTVVVKCENDISINVVVTEQCGCIVCNQAKDPETGEVSTQDTSVVFYGRAFGVDNNEPLIFGEVLLGGNLKTYTGFTGNFHFSVPQGQTRIVVHVRPSRWYLQNLIPATKVFQIPAGHIGSFYRDIPMMEKKKPTQIDPRETNRLTIATVKEGSGEPFVQALIPPGQFVDSKGKVSEGKVNAFMNFVDPRDLSSMNTMPGDLTFEDEDGNTGPLETSGMFRLGFEKLDGTEVTFKGSASAAIRANFIDQTQDPPVQLYTLDEVSGRWKDPTKLERGTKGESEDIEYFSDKIFDPRENLTKLERGKERQKRQQSSFTSTFLVGNTVITDRYWLNFDRPALNYCFINMRMFTDATFNTEIPWTSSTDLTVIALGSMPGYGPSWNTITTGGMSYEGKSGIRSIENCILTVCGATNIHAYLFAENENGAFSSSATLGGSPPEYSVVNSIPAFTGMGPTTSHNRPIETNATLGASISLNTDGPVYHSVNNLCESPAYCSSNCPNSANPRCFLCDSVKCQYHAWWSSVRCQEATLSDSHYRFYRDPNTLYEYSVCLTAQPIIGIAPVCPGTPALWPLAWFPQAPTVYWAWYIKVRVLVGSSGDESSVRATSKDSSTGDIYGIREDTTTSRTVCLEFKGSGPTFPPPGSTITLVEIDVQGTGCSVSSVLPALASFQVATSLHLFAFQPPLGSSYGGISTGLYFADETAMNTAKDMAKARCECSDISLGSPNCAAPLPTTGVGLTVQCQPTPSG